MSLSCCRIWYHLLDSISGLPYNASAVDGLSLPFGSDVSQFRDAVYLKNSSVFPGLMACQFEVYKNKPAFDQRSDGAPLKSSLPIDDLGKSEEEALIIVVPTVGSINPSLSQPSRTGKEINPQRKQRWIELNKIFDGNTKKAKTNNSTANSYITWNEVKDVFKLTKYIQEGRIMDNDRLIFLKDYLSIATKCFGSITTGKEAQRLHFIAPILACVCSLLEGKVGILFEEDLAGNFVKAHGRFEFMITHAGKAVCIVEAKKDDLEQGMAQDLVGCEVAAEVGGLDIVYGIVTNYIQWNFYRSLNDKVEADECSLHLTPTGPNIISLKEIAEKIYGMLTIS